MSPVPRVPWQAKYLALVLIWGSSFLLMKVGLESLSAVQIAALRLVAGRRDHPRPAVAARRVAADASAGCGGTSSSPGCSSARSRSRSSRCPRRG